MARLPRSPGRCEKPRASDESGLRRGHRRAAPWTGGGNLCPGGAVICAPGRFFQDTHLRTTAKICPDVGTHCQENWSEPAPGYSRRKRRRAREGAAGYPGRLLPGSAGGAVVSGWGNPGALDTNWGRAPPVFICPNGTTTAGPNTGHHSCTCAGGLIIMYLCHCVHIYAIYSYVLMSPPESAEPQLILASSTIV